MADMNSYKKLSGVVDYASMTRHMAERFIFVFVKNL